MPADTSNDSQGQTPVFILSMPRSGSTLLQRILSTHGSIATIGEPHFLVPLLYGLRREGVYAEYNHPFTVAAIEDFLENLPNGKATYRQAVAQFAAELYGKAATSGESFFVDKAPRYALIGEEMLATFPEAKFILLWRNPLAVAASLLETYHGGAWRLHRADDHLYLGLPRLLDVARNHAERLHVMRYEDLVTDPRATMHQVAKYIGLNDDGFDLGAAPSAELRGTVGDKMGPRKYDRIAQSSVGAWARTFHNPLRRTWAEGYLRWIGDENLAMMGYDRKTLTTTMRTTPPSNGRLASDLILMTYGAIHRRLDPPIWRAKTQDSLWRYIEAASRPLRKVLRRAHRKTRSARPARRNPTEG